MKTIWYYKLVPNHKRKHINKNKDKLVKKIACLKLQSLLVYLFFCSFFNKII